MVAEFPQQVLGGAKAVKLIAHPPISLHARLRLIRVEKAIIVHAICMCCIRKARQYSDSNRSSVVEAAWTCHIQIGVDSDKGYVPVEVVAFIAEACWARQVYNILRSFNSNVTIS